MSREMRSAKPQLLDLIKILIKTFSFVYRHPLRNITANYSRLNEKQEYDKIYTMDDGFNF